MESVEYRIMHSLEQTHWWFVGRQYLVRDQLAQLDFKGLKELKILDVGCGTGIILKNLDNIGTAYGIEFSPEAIQLLKERDLSSIVRADVNKSVPFGDETFTVITCLDVLEHIEDDSTLLEEMVRVCKPGGYIFLTVPAFKVFWSPHDVALRQKRRYTRKQMLGKVGNLPCEAIKGSYYNSILSLPILAVRIFKTYVLKERRVRSDFFLTLPPFLNKALAFLFMAEIRCLKFLNFPFGVSLLIILKKAAKDNSDK